jgi:hypothetical protein
VSHRHLSRLAATLLAAILVTLPLVPPSPLAAEQLPTRLTDQEFWRLASEYSEPDGTFHSENLVSNEIRFQTVIPSLMQKAVPGRAYVGVGSEQNFTYIAAVRPAIVFIVDIRRGNLDLHLIYKALFEMSADRAEFVSRMFSLPRPAGLTASSTAQEIFTAYAQGAPSQALYDQNLKTIKEHLTTKHGFKLSAGDLSGVDFVYGAWFQFGPKIRYELTSAGRGGLRGGGSGFPSYAELMTADDGTGTNRSFLASDATFKFLKDLHTRNMIIPVVGNFGGPKALRAVAAYLKQKETVVSAFYTSNVEQYLRQDGIWGKFCASAATMPLDEKSVFIRSARGGFANQPAVTLTPGATFAVEVLPLKPEVAACPAP